MNTFNRKQTHATKNCQKKAQIRKRALGVRQQYVKEQALTQGGLGFRSGGSGKAKAKERKALKRDETAKALLLQNNEVASMEVEVTKKVVKKAVRKSARTAAMVE